MASGIFKYEPLWGEWYIDELIGKGSYGEVYKIHKEVEGVRIEAAAKYISIPKAEDKKSYRQYTQKELVTLFDERADKFSVEISSMLKLRDSQNVVRYEDHIKKHKDKDIGWDIIIRMELLTSLEDYLDDNNFSSKDVAKLGIDICSAIECCQANDIIHRDIKIENIFVDPLGNYKLGDFGVSKVGSGTATGTVTGTEDYMAPEISQEHKYNKTVDIYALGIAMYQLLNNRRKPFIDADSVPGQDAEAQAHIKRIKGEQMPSPKYANEDMARIVLKACAFDRHDRYSSPSEMANELKSILESLTDEAVITARGRRDFYPDDEETEEENPGGGTVTDIPGKIKKGGGTVTDIPGKKDNGGTVRDVNPPKEPRKEKSKKAMYAWIGVVCIAIIGLILLLMPKNIEIETIEGLPEEVVQMVVGDTLELKPEVLPVDATSKLMYTSDNENTATVDENGLITAVEVGEVKITIQGDDNVNYVLLNIVAKKVPVTDIIGLSSTAELTIGSSITVNARVQPDDATEQQITYSSSNTNVATIGPDGVITAVSAGKATIKASADGVVKEMVLTVKAKAPANNYSPPKTTQTTPKTNNNNYTPPANNTPAVNNTPANNNAGTNNQSGGGSSGREIANPDGDRYY